MTPVAELKVWSQSRSPRPRTRRILNTAMAALLALSVILFTWPNL
jgi:hypothetical protein